MLDSGWSDPSLKKIHRVVDGNFNANGILVPASKQSYQPLHATYHSMEFHLWLQ